MIDVREANQDDNPPHDDLQNNVEEPHHKEDPPFDVNALAIVPYKPPALQHADVIVGMVRVVYGPPLPPEMAWTRNFDSLLQCGSVTDVPRPINLPHIEHVFIPKRSLTIAFDDSVWASKLVPVEVVSSLKDTVCRQVARALFPSLSKDKSALEPVL